MSNTPQGAEPPLATFDRRLRARRSVPSLAYVDLGENNGGIILNLGEGGLAVTSAAPLDTGGPARMQFRLPGSSDRLAARGEITWISESKKEAGLRFVDLSEDVRSRITVWVSSREFPGQFDRKTTAVPVKKALPVGPPPTHSVKSTMAEFTATNEAAHGEVQSLTRATTDTPSRGGEGSVASHNPQEEKALPDHLHVERPLETSDRRMSMRRPLPSLAYIDLGENNGGIILNLSEGGLAVTSAAPLHAEGLARMQFQLPGSSDWLKVNGETAWISQSKKEAGLRFVDLSDDVRHQITSWISSETLSIRFESEGAGSREKAWRRLEMPTIRTPLQSADHAEATARRSTPALHAAPTRFTVTTDQRLGVAAGDRPRNVLLQRRTWATLGLIVGLGALTSFLVGWFTAGPDSLARILARFGKTTTETSGTANDVESPPAGSVTSVPDLPVQSASPPTDGSAAVFASKDVNSISPSVGGTRAQGPSKDLAPPGDPNVGASSPHMANPHEHVLKPPMVSTTANVLPPPSETGRPPGPASVAAQPQGASVSTPPPAGPIVNQPQGATSSLAGQESSLPPKLKENPEVAKPSFSVNFNPYPSIRVPAGLKSQMSQQGMRLEIGQLLSRVDPVYPEEAETRRVEGTVKLHVVIGPDGSVQSLEPVSGPALLIPAAVNAVRQWRYTESSIGGQPVEAEEDITITFRLVTQAAHPN